MAALDLDAIRERDAQDFAAAANYPGHVYEDRHVLLKHITELERELIACAERGNQILTAAQAVVAVADGDMNRELLDAIDALDATLEGSTEKQ